MNVQREGFSLVEFVIALAVLAIVAAIALPAVNRAREAARQTTCLDNLRRLGAGVHTYQTTHKVFPPGQLNSKFLTNVAPGFCADPAEAIKPTPGGQGTSWIVQVLPHIEQAALHKSWNFKQNVLGNAQAASVEIAGLYCPSRRTNLSPAVYGNVQRVAADWTGGGNDYAGCAGSGIVFDDKTRATYVLSPEQVAATAGGDGWSPYNQDPLNAGIFGVNSRIRLEDIGDGASQTMLICERRLTDSAGPESQISSDGWAWGGPATLMSCRLLPHTGVVFSRGLVPAPPTGGEPGHFDEADSSHPGIVNVCLADGSARAVSFNISLSTWRELGSANGGVPVRLPD
ncbi:DUF1559 domain-containing protein [Planctomyces sp. SH-PL14]|uniref:DUF1559 family PulG-like putative transporter n=1 Tax=Planctomyces sp. SH-PL14 TaxID=1632864 RepID=UPI00078BF568|nr:DUF1559 domain-containing protein [Planctomyces sp. SH-PL14]AMV18988.1 hypothetical protein VT03_13950 [Planctomyces sp. SH-PL14]